MSNKLTLVSGILTLPLYLWNKSILIHLEIVFSYRNVCDRKVILKMTMKGKQSNKSDN